jgi:hypothetical protein
MTNLMVVVGLVNLQVMRILQIVQGGVGVTTEAVRHPIVIGIMTTSAAHLDVVAMLLLGPLRVFSCDALLRLDGMRTIR